MMPAMTIARSIEEPGKGRVQACNAPWFVNELVRMLRIDRSYPHMHPSMSANPQTHVMQELADARFTP
eukprot:12598719-Alexandrium_andersonii.AAC.1